MYQVTATNSVAAAVLWYCHVWARNVLGKKKYFAVEKIYLVGCSFNILGHKLKGTITLLSEIFRFSRRVLLRIEVLLRFDTV